MIEVTVGTKFDVLQIKIGGALHLRLKLSKLLGFQAWRTGNSCFAIEYTMAGGSIYCEYDDEPKWRAVLDGLDGVAFDQSRQP